MKVGIRLNIDVTKIDKSAIYEGQKGKYLSIATFVDLDEEDRFGNNGMVTQDLGKDRRNEKGPILGNAKVFWRGDSSPATPAHKPAGSSIDEDIPF